MNRQYRAAACFLENGEIRKIEPLAGGRINETFRVHTTAGTSCLLQRLNPAVFPNPALVQANVEKVCAHIHNQLALHPAAGIRMPELLRSTSGHTGVQDDDGSLWRMFTFLEDTRTLDVPASPGQAREMGMLLGRFHHWLRALDPARLHDPLPGFHITPNYLTAYDRLLRTAEVSGEGERQAMTFVATQRNRADVLEKNRARLTSSVIHGDPKAANFLFDPRGERAISLIDLDTVMSGLLLHDIADCLRSCCNRSGEEAKGDGENSFDREMFAAVLEGYAARAGDRLSRLDRELLVEATWLICFELGLRFLTDHLAGNRYFRADAPGQNLRRSLGQFQLAKSIDRNRKALETLRTNILP